ncbi:gamma-glutamyltransferase family protein [Nisaea sediminum]|uniref:gamma-glutamyltransferase family protein n=1 Tax=Nisaea sediminum TaxID=2775867 RepID=UPI001869675F|nr:gamma-glutamyltransferase [Nisaea sediminum]
MAEPEPILSTWQQGKPEVGAAATGNADATRAALDTLEAGGNAIDAAVAAAYVMGTVEPLDSGIGAGGFMILHDAASGRTESIDFLGTCPAAAKYELYASMDAAMQYVIRVKGRENERGHRSVAVPGSVRGLGAAQAKFGKLAMQDVLAPAIALAEGGFRVGHKAALRMARTEKLLNLTEATRKLLLKADGSLYRAGDEMANPEYGASLRLIAKEGPEVFYEGELGDRLIAEMEAHDGFLSKADLRGYEAIWRAPATARFKGYDVATMPPPSSGSLVFAGLAALEGETVVDGAHYGQLADAMLAMFRKRAASFGDPAFLKAAPGESSETTSLAVVDRDGNAACITYSNNNHSGVVLPGTGILLNNQMMLFSPWPGNPNEVVPGKRPVSSMMPSLMFRDGKIRMAIGASGATRIPTSIMQVLFNRLVLGDALPEAVGRARVHAETESMLADAELEETVRPLADARGLGLTLSPGRDPMLASVQAVGVNDDGTMAAVGDPRARAAGMVR